MVNSTAFVEEGKLDEITFGDNLRIAAAGSSLVVVDVNNHCIRIVKASGTVETLAGQCGRPGNKAGRGKAAQLSFPSDVAANRNGTLYVADTGNNQIVEITRCGVVRVYAGGFVSPIGISVVPATQRMYVSDKHRISLVSSADESPLDVKLLAGSLTAGYANGAGASARFNTPGRAAISGTVIYVPDIGNSCIRRMSSGGVTSLIAGIPGSPGFADGPGLSAQFQGLSQIWVMGGNIDVADTGNNVIRRMSLAAGNAVVRTISPELLGPTSAVTTAASAVFIADGPRLLRVVPPAY
jgi:hypothetical protein